MELLISNVAFESIDDMIRGMWPVHRCDCASGEPGRMGHVTEIRMSADSANATDTINESRMLSTKARQRIHASKSITLHTCSEVVSLEGANHLSHVTWQSVVTGDKTRFESGTSEPAAKREDPRGGIVFSVQIRHFFSYNKTIRICSNQSGVM
jgi:hypothetical protein